LRVRLGAYPRVKNLKGSTLLADIRLGSKGWLERTYELI